MTARELFEAAMEGLGSDVKWDDVGDDDHDTYEEKAQHANRVGQTLKEAAWLIRRELGG